MFLTNFKKVLIFFSPAGWDNEKKIAILHENMHSIKPDQVNIKFERFNKTKIFYYFVQLSSF